MIRLIAAALLAASTVGAAAQTACYGYEPGPKVFSCEHQGNATGSADFTAGCVLVDGPPVVVEVPCPGAVWVPVVERPKTYTPGAQIHADTCATYGMTPTSVDGASCASGALQPASGDGWEAISYPWGTAPGASHTGGDRLSMEPPTYPLFCTQAGKQCGASNLRHCWAVAVACTF